MIDMTKTNEQDKGGPKDEIKSFIEKKKVQNKALQKMMEQLENSKPIIEKNNIKQ